MFDKQFQIQSNFVLKETLHDISLQLQVQLFYVSKIAQVQNYIQQRLAVVPLNTNRALWSPYKKENHEVSYYNRAKLLEKHLSTSRYKSVLVRENRNLPKASNDHPTTRIEV